MRRARKTLIGREPIKIFPDAFIAMQAKYNGVIADLKANIGLTDEMLNRAKFGLVAVVHLRDSNQSVHTKIEVDGIEGLVKAAADLHDAFYLHTNLDVTMYRNTIYYYETISYVETAAYYIGDKDIKFDDPGPVLDEMMPTLLFAGDLYQTLRSCEVCTPEQVKAFEARKAEHIAQMQRYTEMDKENTDHEEN